jgi:hypothetical protein
VSDYTTLLFKLQFVSMSSANDLPVEIIEFLLSDQKEIDRLTEYIKAIKVNAKWRVEYEKRKSDKFKLILKK